jgi:hypothetical protein
LSLEDIRHARYPIRRHDTIIICMYDKGGTSHAQTRIEGGAEPACVAVVVTQP